jgi:hypothetical protein
MYMTGNTTFTFNTKGGITTPAFNMSWRYSVSSEELEQIQNIWKTYNYKNKF